MYIAAFQAGGQPRPSLLKQMNLDARMALSKPPHEFAKQDLDDLRCGADTKHSGVPFPDRTRAFTQGIDFDQDTSAVSQ